MSSADEPSTPAFTHAGGIVCRVTDAGVVVLLARASKPPFEWILPKGHIEKGESPPATAVREVREETGIDAAAERAIGTIQFVDPKGRQVRAVFFLMTYRRSGTPHEARETRWCSFDEARRLLPFADLRDLIDSAKAAVES